jgi:site-specific recombinase XerD
MIDNTILGPWINRFLLEYLPGERNLARNTQRSYRDTIRLLVLFLAAIQRRQVEELAIADLSASSKRVLNPHRAGSKLSRCDKESEACGNPRTRAIR